jgi:hypothetical protein
MLTERQRRVFTTVVVQGVPLDAFVERLGGSRNEDHEGLLLAARETAT